MLLKKLCIGGLGGMLYIYLTWAATLTGVLEWYQDVQVNTTQEAVSILAPFSLMALFLFASILLYHQWQPQEKGQRPISKLMIIGTGFALGATLTQLLLMEVEGIPTKNSLLIAVLFFVSSLGVAFLIALFYRFLRN